MKTIFDKTTVNELIERINSLSSQNKARWEKWMPVKCLNIVYLGKKKYERLSIRRMFGRMALGYSKIMLQ